MKIVVLDGGILNPGDVSWRPVEELGELVVYDDTKPEEVGQRARNADVILVNKVRLDKSNIPDLDACSLVSALATGVNNLDLNALAEAGIQACNVPAYGVSDVAQHALALLLELARNTRLHSDNVREGGWEKAERWCFWIKTPLALNGLTMGIIGFGAIGQALGRMAHGLGMRVLAYSRHQNAQVDYPFTYASLPELFRQSQVISLHCPLTPETAQIINEKSIAALPDGAIIINTARGGLVEEKAVAEALKNGKLYGFGTDVLSVEPPAPDNPLLNAPNVLITPHIAWATRQARQKIIDITAENIKTFMVGQPLNAVNKPCHKATTKD